ncbi:MAG: YeeE/YedE family protein [Hyphomicrobiaceae bacterium]|nr:YeeE/YedE family protein [Hyphomicrobiaceae bacterium]
MQLDWLIVAGFLCGVIAGGAARYGRLCSMSAIEDALVGQDYRGASAWLLAVSVAGLATLALVTVGLADVGASLYGSPRLHLLGVAGGGAIFGLGMTLAGTCSFGLIVRAGSGDLAAAVSALVVGILAYAVTAGVLAPMRAALLDIGVLDLSAIGGGTLDAIAAHWVGLPTARAMVAIVLLLLAGLVVADRRMRQRPRLLAGAILLGLTVAAGWAVTTVGVRELSATRVESLSFVAPVGRALLQTMALPFRGVGFGVASVIGVFVASMAVAAARRELRWEAFDDPTEMRRHLAGAALMGVGGVLAQGCTIGQGLSAASVLALSAPLFVIAVLAGARIGLSYLIEGTALWRLGFSPRSER